MYSATVLVAEQGGIGIPPPNEELDFGDVSPGLNMSRHMVLKNEGNLDSYVVIISWGSIRDFMGISDAFFHLEPGNEKTVEFKVRPPAGAEAKRYSGRVLVVRVPWWWPF
jgi:hypothetical protein